MLKIKSVQNILINLLLIFIALLLSLVVIIGTIASGAGIAALSMFGPRDTDVNFMLSVLGTATPTLLVAALTYLIFTRPTFKKTWLILFFSLPMQAFWLYIFSGHSVESINRWLPFSNFLVIAITFILILYKSKCNFFKDQ